MALEVAGRVGLALRCALGGLLCLEGGGVAELGAEVDADEAQWKGDEEGQAPAPGLHGVVAEDGLEDHRDRSTEHVAAEGTDLQQAAEEATFTVWGVLRDEGHGVGVLAAGREALQEAAEQQQERCGHADGGVVGDDADEEGGGRHHDHRDGEDTVTSDAVGERSEDQAADRADEEGDREEAGGDDLACCAGILRKEHPLDGQHEVAVDAEVVPFGDVSDGGGVDGGSDGGGLGDGHVVCLPPLSLGGGGGLRV